MLDKVTMILKTNILRDGFLSLFKVITLVTFIIGLMGCAVFRPNADPKDPGILKVIPISENVFQHISYLIIPVYGPFPCNGIVYIHDGEALVFDTPIGKTAAKQLIHWIEKEKQSTITGVVVNHFHVDCLGSLDVFHKKGIPSYAHNQTLAFAKKQNLYDVPKIGFKDTLNLKIGKKKVLNQYFGQGHTKDNIVSFLPDESLLFGGCMIKADQAGKGNLNDANVEEWPKTVQKIKNAFPGLKVVVPGHGEWGDTKLLDYTIKLFSNL